VVTEPMTVAGQHLHEGSRVLFMLLAANRDPGVFERPDEVDVGRSPNPHLGFGKGSHYCIGAGLARLEMTESIEAIIDMAPNLELAGQVEWSSSLGLRSAVKLPVSVSR
jgi:cytochrome P450